MATYNGAAYLPEQLGSFVTQSRLPDELVITDDGSTDDTLAIIEAFTGRAPFEVRYAINEKNLGYAANFDRAIQQCTGDLIFLSDQDDVWLPEKIARIEAEFERNPGALLVMCDAELVHADGSQTGLTKREQTLALGFNDDQFVTGCCMAFRRELVPLLSPVPTDVFVHDTWINRLALDLAAKRVLPKVMQHYRRHGSNTSTWIACRTEKLNQLDLYKEYRNADPRLFYLHRLKQLQVVEQRLQDKYGSVLDGLILSDRVNHAMKALQLECRAVETRMAVMSNPRWRRPPHVLAAWFTGHYRFFRGWKSAVMDLIRT